MSKAEDALAVLLASEYPGFKVLPQYHVRYKNTNLYIDYYIPALRRAFETDGRQHETFVEHFHKTKSNFDRAKANDRLKKQWCDENGVTLIRFHHKEPVDKQTLRRKIQDLIAQTEDQTGGN